MFLGTLGVSMLGNIFKWKKSCKSWKRIETYGWKLFVPLAPSFKEYRHYQAGIFPSTFLQPVDSSKNPVLNWVMNFNLLMSIFFLKNPWKIFHYIHLFFLLFGVDTYKHAWRQVVCIFLVNFSSKLPIKL